MPLFFGSPYNKELLILADFSADYNLSVTVESLPDIRTPPNFYNIQFTYSLEQFISGNKLLNTVKLKDAISLDETGSNALQELIALSKISTVYKIGRNMKGEVIEICNTAELINDWQKAKVEIVPGLYKNPYEKRAFVLGYEKGLHYMDKAISNNWQYLMMMPEVYNFNHYTDPYNLSKTKVKNCKSGLLQGVIIDYRMYGASVSVQNDVISLQLLSETTNTRQLPIIEKEKIKGIPDSYSFEVVAFYEIEKTTGKVLSASASITEKTEVNTFYKLRLNLESTAKPVREQEEIKELPKRSWSVFDGIDDPHIK